MSVNVKAHAVPPIIVPSRVRIGLAMLAIYTIWGSTYLAIRVAVVSFPPLMMTSIRLFGAGIALMLFLLARGTPLPPRKQVGGALFIGALMLGAGTGGVAFAEQWVASGLAALAVAAVPIWAAVFAGILGRWPNRVEWIGLGIGLVGVALLNLENGMQGSPLGALVLLLGPMSWAFGSMLSQRVSMPSGLMGAAVEMFGGGFVLLVMSVLLGEHMDVVPTFSALLALLYLMVFGSIIAFSAYMFLLGTVRPVLATSYAYVNPVIAVLLGILFAGEHITEIGLVAMIVILSGVALLAFGRYRKVPPERDSEKDMTPAAASRRT